MSTAYKALQDFLTNHCEVKNFTSGSDKRKERCYMLPTEDCLLFMAENHVQEMRNVLDQTPETTEYAKANGEYGDIIMAYNWGAPEPGMDSLRIPVKLIESLDDKRALMILRSLEGIQKDIDIGKARKAALLTLFRDVATIRTFSNLEGERLYLITGTTSESDRRLYAERYAELVATSVLFNLPKALNVALQKIVPKEARGRFFVEGRDIAAPKIAYGAHAHVELALTDEGAEIYTELAKKDSSAKEAISKLFRQAIIDPFGLSLKFYMGKHALIKLPEKKKPTK